MKKIVEKAGRILSTLVCIVGIFGCLCECETSDWWKYLFIFFTMFIVGIVGNLAFIDLVNTRIHIRKMFKKIEGLWIFICYRIKLTYEDLKDFMSIVKYYRSKDFSYTQIAGMAIKAKREADIESK